MKKATLILLVLLTGTIHSIKAQNQVRIDSLLNTLKTAKGTTKVDIWDELSWEYHKFNPEKAIEYGEKALGLSQKKEYNEGIASSLRVIGLAYRSRLDFTHALKYFHLALPFEERANNLLGEAQCWNDIGEVYKNRGDYKRAIDAYKKAVQRFEQTHTKEGTANALSNLADTYYKVAKYKTAKEFALQSLAIAEQTGTNRGIRDASLILSEVYANVGNFQEAYRYQKLFTSIKDSVSKAETKREISLMERKFEKERLATEQKMEQERETQQALVAKQRRDTIQYTLIFLIFVGLFASIFVIGKFDIPQYYVESLIFLTLLLVFRFILIIFTSLTNTYSEGAPLFILGANVILALMFMPLHKFIEGRLKKKVIEEHADDEKLQMRVINKLKSKFSKASSSKKTKKQKNHPALGHK